jgi:hypothetical protein
MNQQGVFLTLMVFLVGIIVVGLAISSAGIQKERESLVSEETARETVNEQFSEAYYAVSDFLQNPAIERERSRVLPFKYRIRSDRKQIQLQQTMPIESDQFGKFNDYLNLYELFWKTKSDLNSNFSFEKNKNAAWTNDAWAYEENGYQFKILPQCVLYQLKPSDNENGIRVLRLTKGTIADNNCEFDRQQEIIGGNPGTGTDSLRNWHAIEKIIVTVHTDQTYEIAPTCRGEFFNGAECWKKPFDSNRGWPYGEVRFMSGNETYGAVYNHFEPDSGNPQEIDFNLNSQNEWTRQKVVFSADPINGPSQILLVDLSDVKAEVNPIVDVTLFFRKPVESFQLENLSLSVENIAFGMRRLSLNQPPIAYCGDDNCTAPSETVSNCPKDCTCGNGKCEEWENLDTCSDCTDNDSICSDGSNDPNCGCSITSGNAATCDPEETLSSCPLDCAWTCGNGTCDSGENYANCQTDCEEEGCTNQCETEGETRCNEGSPASVSTCTLQGECLVWVNTETCPLEGSCLDGYCRDCQDECLWDGYRECVGSTSFHQCGYYENECLNWGNTILCGLGKTCNNGQCQSGSGTG